MKISQLYVYPIKSLRGCSVPSAQFTDNGIAFDRSFMLLKRDGAGFKNMSVARMPEMCLFTTHITYPSPEDPFGGEIEVTYNDPVNGSKSSISVPLQPDSDLLEPMEVKLHESITTAYVMPADISSWFSAQFGYEVILLSIGDNRRPVLGNFAPNAAIRNPQKRRENVPPRVVAQSETKPMEKSSSWFSSLTNTASSLLGASGDGSLTPPPQDNNDYSLTFADCSPYMVVSDTSVANVTARLPTGYAMDVTKLRPNVVVSGAPAAWEEDFWRELTITSSDDNAPALTKLTITQNCLRCVSLNIDYATGKPGTGPEGQILKYLASDRRIDSGSKYSSVCGRYAFLKRQMGLEEGSTVKVGDDVAVTSRMTERTAFKWPGFFGVPKEDLWVL